MQAGSWVIESASSAGLLLRDGLWPWGVALTLAAVCAVLGFLLAPYVIVLPLRGLWRLVQAIPLDDLIAATVGLLLGLFIAALSSVPLSNLPGLFGRWLPFGAALLFSWLGVTVCVLRKAELFELIKGLRARASRGHAGGADARRVVLLDTSAIIDGRLVEVQQSGFLNGRLVAPRFVLEELQTLADSADLQRRQRGRRGLEMLSRLRRDAELEVLDTDFTDLRGVDSKLVRLAKRVHGCILTTDFNLNQVAGLQGVPVLNVAELANAVRPVVSVGDEMAVQIVQEGRERGQGVGFLEDGTMIVVEGGRKYLNAEIPVEVTRVLPTAAGRMIFARPRADSERPATNASAGSS